MPLYQVDMSFTKLPDGPLVMFGENIEEKMTGNPSYTTPRIAIAALATKRGLFSAAVAGALPGGTDRTAIRNALHEEYVNMLRQQGLYVQSIANEDLPMLLSSGFEARSTNRARIQLPQPVIERLYVPVSTMIAAQVQALANAAAYQLRYKMGAGDYVELGTFTYSRPIFIHNCVPGQSYTVQARAVGGSNGYSDWSNPVSIMAM